MFNKIIKNINIYKVFFQKISTFRYLFIKKKNFYEKFLEIIMCLILLYLLIKSSFSLLCYLVFWNLLPSTQYLLYYNPIHYEIYLRLLCVCMWFYTFLLLKKFPQQFNLYLWIYQQITLSFFLVKNKILTKNLIITIFVTYIIFFFLFIKKFHFFIYLFWVFLLLGEIFCLNKIKSSFSIIKFPAWLKQSTDLKNFNLLDSEKISLSKFEDNIFIESEYLLDRKKIQQSEVAIGKSPSFIYEMDETMSLDITNDDFEEFFLDNNFNSTVSDIFDEENTNYWINWFWIRYWVIQIPLFCLINLLICFLIITWGVPENYISYFQDYLYEDRMILEEYQNRYAVIPNQFWANTWRWLLGGAFMVNYWLRNSNIYSLAKDYLEPRNNFNKYIYYRTAMQSRSSYKYNQLFFFYDFLNQFKTFILKSRFFPTIFRETFLYKFYIYDDLYKLKQLKYKLNSYNNTTFDYFQKVHLISWLYKKTKNWIKDYYFVEPAVNIYPDKYQFWLSFYRFFFVIDELFEKDSSVQKILSFLNKNWYNEESFFYFLEDVFFPTIDKELYFDFEFRNKQEGIFTQILEKSDFDDNLMNFIQNIDNTNDYDDIFFVYPYFTKLILDKLDNKFLFTQDADLLDEYEKEGIFVLLQGIVLNDVFGEKSINANEVLDQFLENKYIYKTTEESLFSPLGEDDVINNAYDNTYNMYSYNDILQRVFNRKSGGLNKYEYFFLYDLYNKYYSQWYFTNKNAFDVTKQIIALTDDEDFELLKKYGHLDFHKMIESLFKFFKLEKQYEKLVEQDNQFKLVDISRNKYSVSTLEQFFDEDIVAFDEFLETNMLDSSLYNDELNNSATGDKNYLNSFYHQSNMDILYELLFENNVNQATNTNLLNYIKRSDFAKLPQKKREFIFNDYYQLYAYAASHFVNLRLFEEDGTFMDFPTFKKKNHFYYKEADFFEIMDVPPIWSKKELDELIFEKEPSTNNRLEKIFKNLLRQVFIKSSFPYYNSLVDTLGTEQDSYDNVINQLWYKYYYKADVILNYYDFMPSYRNFYINTWPVEYLEFFNAHKGLGTMTEINENTEQLDQLEIINIFFLML